MDEKFGGKNIECYNCEKSLVTKIRILYTVENSLFHQFLTKVFCMGALISTVLFVICFAFCSSAQAESTNRNQKKIYVENKNIHLNKQGIFIVTPHGNFKLKTLHSDQSGIFIYAEELNAIEKSYRHWRERMGHKRDRSEWLRHNDDDDESSED